MNEQRVREIVQEEIQKSTTKKAADIKLNFHIATTECEIKELASQLYEATKRFDQ